MSDIAPEGSADRERARERRSARAPPSERALAGLGSFSWKVALGTALALLLAAGGLKLSSRDRDLTVPGARASRSPVVPVLVEGAAPRAESAASAVAREIEQRRAAGALQQAVRRFEPCPGGDVRRTAWVDGDRIVKIARDRADGGRIEEWFDREGRLREAVARDGAAPSPRRLVLDEAGRTADADPPWALDAQAPLDLRDPSRAFFGGAGCAR